MYRILGSAFSCVTIYKASPLSKNTLKQQATSNKHAEPSHLGAHLLKVCFDETSCIKRRDLHQLDKAAESDLSQLLPLCAGETTLMERLVDVREDLPFSGLQQERKEG